MSVTFRDQPYRAFYNPVTPIDRKRHYGGVPIIIDNGSYECRAGFATDADPRLRFLSMLGRAKNARASDGYLIGHQMIDPDRVKARTPWDGPIVYHFELMEYLMDYIFMSLGFAEETDGLAEHPVVITECPANVNASRAQMSEMLFECYNVPSICYGIDSFFSFYYNQSKGYLTSDTREGLVISSGHETTYVLPFLGAPSALSRALRINVGSAHGKTHLQSLLMLKYPQHKGHITPSRCREIVETYTVTAPGSYKETLESMAPGTVRDWLRPTKPPGCEVNPVVIQLPFTKAAAKFETEEEREEKERRRQENLQRMRELQQKRSDETFERNKATLESLEALKAKREEKVITEEEFFEALREGGFEDEKDFEKTIKNLRDRLNKSLARRGLNPLPPPKEEQKSDAELYPLLDIPDEQLTEEQRKEKRKQKLFKAAAESRARKRQQQEEERALQEQMEAEEEAEYKRDPEAFVRALKEQRAAIYEKRMRRKGKLGDGSGWSTRRSAAATRRLRLLADAAGGSAAGGDDGFGDDDADWQVYREINAARGGGGGADTESEEEKEALRVLDEKLARYDPESRRVKLETGQVVSERDYQLVLFVERVKIPELVFQPILAGVDQAGLAECIERVFAGFDEATQARMARNIFVTGGNTLHQGFLRRIEYEVRSLRPFGSAFNVYQARDPLLDAWRGAALLASSKEQLVAASMSRREWEEMGPEYFKEHALSNFYYQTPPMPTERELAAERAATPSESSGVSLPGRKRRKGTELLQ